LLIEQEERDHPMGVTVVLLLLLLVVDVFFASLALEFLLAAI
jgi:hypothetical protein